MTTPTAVSGHVAQAEPVITVRDLTFAYNGEAVLDRVSLTVRRGDFLALVGPNGGGKTTLIKCMLGLIGPFDGSIRVLGGPPGSRRLGYVPQHTNIRPDFPITVEDAVLLGLADGSRRLPFVRRAERERAREMLARVELGGLERRRMGELSGGQRQRALIARALVSDPSVLLLDEPTANVDPHGRFCFYELLSGLSRSTTIVVVSHDLSIIASHVTRVACVNRRLAENDRPELTPEMLTLLYGVHDHACAAARFFQAAPGPVGPLGALGTDGKPLRPL